MTAVQTTCAYCGVGCGMTATVTGARSVTVAGDKDCLLYTSDAA
ncbi:MAG: hypothetical protein KUG65_07780, partial [Sphingomonadaceae bacterium]|nr:hypothetical protein [Sphingomonadaceae bacterium]